MKIPMSVFLGGGFLGVGLYLLVTGGLWHLIFDGEFLMYGMLGMVFYLCKAGFRWKWHKAFRRWGGIHRPLDMKIWKTVRMKKFSKFLWRADWLEDAAEFVIILLISILFEEKGALAAFGMFLGAILILLPIYLSIWGAFYPHHLRWSLRFLPFFRNKPSQERLRQIAVSCMGGICAAFIGIFFIV